MTGDSAPFICGTPLIDAWQHELFAASLLPAGWPAPASVRAFATLRGPAGDSEPPFGPLNLGTRSGDDVATVLYNRDNLRFYVGMPAAPCWLHQVHGTRVIAFDGPHPNPPPQAGEGDEGVAPQTDSLPPPTGVRAGACELPVAVRAGSNAGGRMPTAGLLGERTTREPSNGARRAEGGELAREDARSAPPEEILPPPAGEGARRAEGGQLAQNPPEPDADAAVTRTPGVVLAILTADCLPVLFCADDGSEVAAAHAGWRGLCAGVLENTLAAMHAPRAGIMAWLGPAIAAPSYEVGEEVRAAFIAHDPAAADAFIATRPGHWLCDLYALARQRLRAAGITRVFGGGLDTFSDTRLHSYRRDGARSGRMVSLIWMPSREGDRVPATDTPAR